MIPYQKWGRLIHDKNGEGHGTKKGENSSLPWCFLSRRSELEHARVRTSNGLTEVLTIEHGGPDGGISS